MQAPLEKDYEEVGLESVEGGDEEEEENRGDGFLCFSSLYDSCYIFVVVTDILMVRMYSNMMLLYFILSHLIFSKNKHVACC